MYKIAISGLANSGKNTLATMLVKHFGFIREIVKIAALADPIKYAVLQMYPMADRNCLFGPSELRNSVIASDLFDQEGKPLTYRRMLMDLGKLGRIYNGDFWLNALVQDADTTEGKAAYIVADVRFVNEFKYLQASKFFMIRVKRDLKNSINDISETGQAEILDSQFDAVVENYNDLDDLDRQAKLLVDKIHNSAF